MTKRRLAGTLIAVSAVVLAGVGAVVLYQRPQQQTFYTDADTIREPAGTIRPRDVLWQPPARLSEIINTGEEDYEPRLSWDGLTLLFVRGRAGDNADILVSQRTPTGWTQAAPLDQVNSPYDDLGPEPSKDGESLYFYSNRPGGSGGYDVWVSRRVDEHWSAPTNLGPAVNSEYNDYGPALTPDGEKLYFASNRPQPDDPQQPNPDAWPATVREDLFYRTYDIYEAPLTERGVGQARPLAVVNTPYNEGAPCVTPAGDFLYFSSDRPEGEGGFDLYRSWRVRGQLRPPTNLGPSVNSPANELDPGLAWLGYALYFSSDRPVERLRPDRPNDYNLYYTSSREVFAEVEQHTRPPIDWAGLWRAILPNLLWALLALLLLLLLLALGRDARRRRLSLLAKCLLASLMAHLLVMMMLNFWEVTATVVDIVRGRGEIQVALVPSSQADDLAAQIRGQLTDFTLPDVPNTEPAQREPELTVHPDVAQAALSVERVAQPIEESPDVQAVLRDAPQPPVAADLRPDRESEPVVARAEQLRAIQLALPSETSPIDIPEREPELKPVSTTVAARERPRDALAESAALPVAQVELSPQPNESPAAVREAVAAGLRAGRGAGASTARDATPQKSRPAELARSDLAVSEAPALALELPGETAQRDAPREEAAVRPPVAATTAAPRAPARQPPKSAAPERHAHLRPERSQPPIDTATPAVRTVAATDALPPVSRPAVAAGPRTGRNVAAGLRAGRIAEATPTHLVLPGAPPITPAVPHETAQRAAATENPMVQASPVVESASPRAPTSDVRPPDAPDPRVQLPPDHRQPAEADADPMVLRPGRSPAAAVATVSEASPPVVTSQPANQGVAAPAYASSQQLALPPMEEVRSPGAVAAGPPIDRSPEETPPPVAAPWPDPVRAPLSSPVTDRDRARPLQVGPDDLAPPPASRREASLAGDAAAPRRHVPSPGLPASSVDVRHAAAVEVVNLPLAAPAEIPQPVDDYAQRQPARRRAVLESMGGSPETEAAVKSALRWLAAHQSADGHWDGKEFDAQCGGCGGETEYEVDVALTGLSLLCFLGAGHTHTSDGPYQDIGRRAIAWLIERQSPDGDLRAGETMYSHGIAAIALSEAYGMTGDESLADHVRRAVDFIVQARNTETDGWRYEPGDPGDTSVLGWQVMALKSAVLAGVPVPTEAFASAKRWLARVENRSKPGLYGYQPGRRPSPAMTAEGLFTQQLLGTPPDDPRTLRSIAHIARFLPDWDRDLNTYYWYYGTLASFHHGGEPWTRWNQALKPELLAHQESAGPAAGSWLPSGEWAPVGGRVYQTAICTLMLEVYYRYLPLYSRERPAPSPGTIQGLVVSAETGQPLEGATVRLDLADDADISADTDRAGRYELPVPRMPDFFAISASHPGFLPESANVAAQPLRRRGLTVDFELHPRTPEAIVIEAVPEVHHLGNDRFTGRVNSQFQKASEGTSYAAEFELTGDQLAAAEVRLTLLAKGVQCPHEIRINDVLIEAPLDLSPRDGSFGEFSARVDPSLLRPGTNRLEIRTSSCRGDIDDFEFVNVQLHMDPGGR